jgi:hypothetical protein
MAKQTYTEAQLALTVENYSNLIDYALCQGLGSASEWYQNEHDIIARNAKQHGISINVYAAMTAALSPLMKWSENIKSVESIIEGVPFENISGFNRNKVKAQQILDTGDTSILVGPKVRQFYQALLLNPTSTTIDIWMLRATPWGSSVATRDSKYPVIAKRCAAAALNELATWPGDDMTESQIQAVVWVAIRDCWDYVKDYARGDGHFRIVSALRNSAQACKF